MKKTISLFIVVLLCLTLGACTQTPAPVPETAPETPAAEAPVPKTAPETTAPSAVSWDEASNHIGERVTVYGPESKCGQIFERQGILRELKEP